MLQDRGFWTRWYIYPPTSAGEGSALEHGCSQPTHCASTQDVVAIAINNESLDKFITYTIAENITP